MKTAEKFLFESFGIESNNPIGLADALEDEYRKTIDTKRIKTAMIKFAKMHVKAAIKECIESAPSGSSTDTVSYEDVVNALTNCYSLENIK